MPALLRVFQAATFAANAVYGNLAFGLRDELGSSDDTLAMASA